MTTSILIDVPEVFAASYGGQDPEARAWVTRLPHLGGELLRRWELRPDGPAAYGMASLVLPVLQAGGAPAVLKLQQVREETAGVAAGLRAWNGDGVVRLLDHDPDSGAQLLERLDATRPLSALPDDDAAMRILAGLMGRLTAVPAPAGLRRLSDIAAAMLGQAPRAVRALRDPAERRLVLTCAAAVAELAGECGDRLLHWDMHDGNVLAGQREPWLAIDPEPLAGDPGFDLLPALDCRWDAVAAGDVGRTALRRFDLLTEALGLDRQRAAGWTLGRVLQNALWDIEDGKTHLEPVQVTIATALLNSEYTR
ncbi:aminoglycoside phosphotransferase family protein [Nonomuraea sp. 3-1Str]|uniref:aminoglycoside phosphotransferase family protein n=1 Tax=Nonomuraea sp. 3-1Str TaxID=2929801 RepID=UPI002855E4A2|nr:aminoglycoside phosphotransferase family protein [Nonomuraea sp. 3-1Str]MDR8414824.1 aminoglycoside phosphotransferase family protein [Nonomuraea sp. 3-1Str]